MGGMPPHRCLHFIFQVERHPVPLVRLQRPMDWWHHYTWQERIDSKLVWLSKTITPAAVFAWYEDASDPDLLPQHSYTSAESAENEKLAGEAVGDNAQLRCEHGL